MIDTFVVVADGAHARFFATDAEMNELTEVGTLKNQHHAGAHRGGATAGVDSAHHTEEERFAGELAGDVARRVNANEVRDVVLVAPVRFLGDLTADLPKAVARRVTATLGKDLTRIERHALARRLRTAFADEHATH